MTEAARTVKKLFEKSGKKHLFITGSKGSGKTTVSGLIAGDDCSGIITKATPKEKVILTDRTSGTKAVIGVFCKEAGRMIPLKEGFTNEGVKALQNAALYDGNVLIDEIGYLESGIGEYEEALFDLLSKKPVIATLRKEPNPLIERLISRDDVFLCDLDTLNSQVGCVIMASGFSRRFGENKLLQIYDGETFIDRILSATDGLFKERTVVTRYQEIARICKARGVDCILHNEKSKSDTIRLGLEALGDVSGCMFCPADQPLLRRESITKLAEEFAKAPDHIYRLSFGEEKGLPTVFPKSFFNELKSLEGGGGNSVISAHKELEKTVSAQTLWELFDIDTPDDLVHLNNAK